MLIEIKSWATKKVIFSLDCENIKTAVEAAIAAKVSLRSANLKCAYLSGTDLSGANLSSADLTGTDLSRAYLYNADLSRAYLSGAEGKKSHE